MKLSKNGKIFLLVLIILIPFLWWGTKTLQKGLETAIYLKELEKNPPSFFIAEIAQKYFFSQLSAESALSIKIDEKGNEKIIFRKNEDKKMPIASLTKLMTGAVAAEFYQSDSLIQISREAVSQPEETGSLKTGEKLSVNDLLHIMLIESSNDAAFALAEEVGVRSFIGLMNLKANNLKMENTYFFEPTGLDYEDSFLNGTGQTSEEMNFSTAQDLFKLAKYLLKNPLILEITSEKEYPLYLSDGTFHHLLKNSNELLEKIPAVIGGKTGFTEKAGGCLILFLKCQQSENYLINVILNSKQRFNDMEKLSNYAASQCQCY